jgi:hypothetical protein
MKDEDVILLKYTLRFGPNEINKIIDDALSRKNRHPLENYHLLLEALNIYFSQKNEIK